MGVGAGLGQAPLRARWTILTLLTLILAVSNECHQVPCLVWHKNEIQYTVLDKIGDAEIGSQ